MGHPSIPKTKEKVKHINLANCREAGGGSTVDYKDSASHFIQINMF